MEKSEKKVVTKVVRKVIVQQFDVDGPERCKEIEIRLPSNVVRVTGVHVTAALKGFPQP